MEPLPDSSFKVAAPAEPGLASAVSVLYAPVKTFRGLAAKPRFVLPMILLFLLMGVAGGIVMSKLDPDEQRAQMRAQFEGRGLAGQELEKQVEQAAGFMERFGPIVAWAFAGALMVLFVIFATLLFGLHRLAGATELTFLQSLSATFHGLMPGLVSGVLGIFVAMGRTTISTAESRGGLLTSNLGFLAGEETAATTQALLTSVDVFSIWTVLLLGLGFSVLGKVSRTTSTIIVAAVWCVGVLIKVGLAALQS